MSVQQWRGTDAEALSGSLLQWKKPSDLTETFLAGNTKPIMMLVHKSWCGACSRLREELGNVDKAREVAALGENYVLVEALDAEEPTDDAFAPDGKYFPRIVFLDSKGEVRPEFTCSLDANPTFQYFYRTAEQVAYSMKEVLVGLSHEERPRRERTFIGDGLGRTILRQSGREVA